MMKLKWTYYGIVGFFLIGIGLSINRVSVQIPQSVANVVPISSPCTSSTTMTVPTAFDVAFTFNTTAAGLSPAMTGTITNPVTGDSASRTANGSDLSKPGAGNVIAYYDGLKLQFDFPCSNIPDSDGQAAFSRFKAIYTSQSMDARVFFSNVSTGDTTFSNFSEAPTSGAALIVIGNGSVDLVNNQSFFGKTSSNAYAIGVERRIDLGNNAAGTSTLSFTGEIVD